MTDETTALPRSGWAPLTITLAIQALVSMALLTLPSMAPRVAQALAISPAYLGLYIALAYAGAMTASLAAGAAVARYGAIRVSQAGLVLCAGGLALCATASLPLIAAGALLVGMGYGPITPASSHLLARTTPAHRISLVFSVKQTGVPVGGALAGAIVPSLQQFAGWQQALLAVTAANVACAFVSQTLRKDFDADRDASRPLAAGNLLHPVQLVLADPSLRMLATCSFIFSIVQLSLTTYLVTYLTDSLAYGLVAAGALLSVSQMGAVLGRVGFGFLSDRWLGARRMLAVLSGVMAVSALCTALLPAHPPALLVLPVLFVFGATALGWNGVYLAEVARQAPPGMAGVATGGTLAITFFGVMLGPPMFGALAGIFGSYRVGFGALAVPLSVCALVLWRRQRDAAGAQAR
jgi:predicted MFS family arabinose efflux permease